VTRAGSVTIRDVAESAGVSVSTVSLTMNHPGRVSATTRERVQRAIDDLGFVPKAEAVARARRGVGRIGVLGPFTAHTAASRRLNGVLRVASRIDLEVVVFDHGSAEESANPFVTGLPRSGRLDGLVIASLTPDADLVTGLLDRPLPTVLVDGQYPGLSSVRADDAAGGELAADCLLGTGHRTFGFLGESQRSPRDVFPALRRLRGYRNRLRAAGHSLSDDAVAWTPRDFGTACAHAARLLSGMTPPVAVFASDDILAAAILRAARHAGLRTPQDVAVVGFDDSELAEAIDLTTVRQPLEESGELATRLLLDQLRGPQPARTVLLELDLVRRASA
jgi:LacI family transcriptional regulator